MSQEFCWKCHALLNDPVFFKTVCDKCGAYLHTCLGCKNHQVGKPNQCLIPNTETVADREKLNYCEDFKPLGEKKSLETPSVEDVAKRLFKD